MRAELPEAAPLETRAAQTGADVELVAADHPEEADRAVLDERAQAQARSALPGWDVQPFQISRAVDVPDGTDQLRATLEHAVRRHGGVPDILVTGHHLLARIRTAGAAGLTRQDVELATALHPLFPDPSPP